MEKRGIVIGDQSADAAEVETDMSDTEQMEQMIEMKINLVADNRLDPDLRGDRRMKRRTLLLTDNGLFHYPPHHCTTPFFYSNDDRVSCSRDAKLQKSKTPEIEIQGGPVQLSIIGLVALFLTTFPIFSQLCSFFT